MNLKIDILNLNLNLKKLKIKKIKIEMLKKLVNLTENLQKVIYQRNEKTTLVSPKFKCTHEVNMYGFIQKRIVGENVQVPKVDDTKDQKQNIILDQRRFGK